MAEQPTVSDIFRRALELRAQNPTATLADLKSRLVAEYGGRAFPATAFLTIPEFDNITPEEDWSAGLPIVMRGIQNESWDEIADGILISLEQIENYPKESGREDDPVKEWRSRDRRIAGAEEKVVEKWMPDDLIAMAKRSTNA